MIYTLGYEALTPRRVGSICTALDAVLLDCRFKPVSRIPGFGARQLEALMTLAPGEAGKLDNPDQPRYLRMGHLLGGRGHVTPAGIKALKRFAQDEANCVLLCKEEHPIDCHRHRDITGPHYPGALHIWRDRLFFSSDLSRVERGELTMEQLPSGTWADWLQVLRAIPASAPAAVKAVKL